MLECSELLPAHKHQKMKSTHSQRDRKAQAQNHSKNLLLWATSCRMQPTQLPRSAQSRGEQQGTLTLHSLAHLEGHVPYLVDGVRQVVVILQEIKGAEPQQLEGDAHVAVVVKPVKHPDTETDRNIPVGNSSAGTAQLCHPCVTLLLSLLSLHLTVSQDASKTIQDHIYPHNTKHLFHPSPETGPSC